MSITEAVTSRAPPATLTIPDSPPRRPADASDSAFTPDPPNRTIRGLLLVNAANLAVIAVLFSVHGGLTTWTSASGIALNLGRLAGLLGMYSALVQLVLVARIPSLDRSIGMDRLTRWHRVNGHGCLYLILTHVLVITLGYSLKYNHSIVGETIYILSHDADTVLAAVSLALFVGVVAVSIKIARRRLRYETWHLTHLYTYLAVALALPHQLAVGHDFAHDSVARYYWWCLFVCSIAAILTCRIGSPILFNLRHRLRVDHVEREAGDAVSVYITGRNIDRVNARSGQFFLWRFLVPGIWAQAHPYSLSAAPNGRHLRITVRAIGDHSRALGSLKPGTHIFAEGPYGAFTDHARRYAKVLLVAGGIGITPIRSLLESVRSGPGDISVLYYTRNHLDASLIDEIRQLADQRQAQLKIVTDEANVPSASRHGSTDHLHQLVPDINRRDIYVCGPPGLTDSVVRNAIALGADKHAIHFERFAF